LSRGNGKSLILEGLFGLSMICRENVLVSLRLEGQNCSLFKEILAFLKNILRNKIREYKPATRFRANRIISLQAFDKGSLILRD